MVTINAPLPKVQVIAVASSSLPLHLPGNLSVSKHERPLPTLLVAKENEEHMSDDRDTLRPSEFVQQKLQSALYASTFPVSAMHAKRSVRRP